MSRSSSPPTNTLVEGSVRRGAAKSEVFDVLDRPDRTNLLVVSYHDDLGSWFRKWRTNVGQIPSEAGFVRVGSTTRSAASTGPGDTDGPLPFVDAVADRSDLVRLGIRVSEYLESWKGNGRQTVVYFDSLTTLLDSVDAERAFRFFHVLTGRVDSVDGRGYYMIDTAAHEDRSLAVLRNLSDAVVELSESRRE